MALIKALLSAFAVGALQAAAADVDHSNIPLKQYGMIMAHDAASGYLDTKRPIKGEGKGLFDFLCLLVATGVSFSYPKPLLT